MFGYSPGTDASQRQGNGQTSTYRQEAEITIGAAERINPVVQNPVLPSAPKLLGDRLLPVPPASEQDGAFSTLWDTFFPFTLLSTSSGVSARELPALQNIPGA